MITVTYDAGKEAFTVQDAYTAQDAFTATEIAINDLYRMVADLQAEVEQLKGDSV